MRQVILGTAGHIDHGKTSLIKALTGIDTDRLKEEKERGITIELGFAHFTLPDGTRLGIVDVPGHERFVHHMVAGATGMDIVALVVAADEGVMPQTREHLDICKILRIPRGIIVLTKIDLVEDPAWIELVEEDLREAVQGTFLENAPIVRVSSKTGEGMDELVKKLSEIAQIVPERDRAGPFRLPIDRVFTIKGFGTIVTGTSTSGIVRLGDPLMIYPSGHLTRARSLQVHGEAVEEAGPGQRVAINLQGLEKDEIQRGDVVATPESLIPSKTLDVYAELLPNSPYSLKHGSLVRFHTGTSEHIGRIFMLENLEIMPGDSFFAQIHLEHPIPVIRGDRFVARYYSPVITVGGGIIVDPLPKRHRRRMRQEAAAMLKSLMGASDEETLLRHVINSKERGISFGELQVKTGLYGKRLETILGNLEKRESIFNVDKDLKLYISKEFSEELEKSILSRLEEYHRENPLKQGMSKELLISQFAKDYSQKVMTFVLNRLIEKGIVLARQEIIALSTHSVRLNEREKKIASVIEKIYFDAGSQPPSFKEIAPTLNTSIDVAERIFSWMIDEGLLVRVKEELVFHKEILEKLKDQLVSFLKTRGEVSPSQFKELAGTTRKYAVPLLEYFDREKITLRVGDVRRLRE
ncbi:MAG: selenocysteine-specific translation elongation factor [Syntrophobacterales bacterium]|nr:selenocysteine-specific translation elongation factor [Syntrophobacterales bacterium]